MVKQMNLNKLYKELDDIVEDYNINKEIINDTKRAINYLINDNVLLPDIEYDEFNDGIIMFWNTYNYEIGIGIYPNKNISYFYRKKNEPAIYFDGIYY